MKTIHIDGRSTIDATLKYKYRFYFTCFLLFIYIIIVRHRLMVGARTWIIASVSPNPCSWWSYRLVSTAFWISRMLALQVNF
jgi:hypothetical protein